MPQKQTRLPRRKRKRMLRRKLKMRLRKRLTPWSRPKKLKRRKISG